MAREEIKLVGSFKDDITPQLKKLNKEIANIGRSFERFNKKIAPVTKSFAKMAMSARTFSEAMSSQRRSIESSARSMREYSRQAGKMSNAMRKVTDQRLKAQRSMGVSRAQARKGGGDAFGGGGPSGGGKGAGGSGAAWGTSAATGFNRGIGSIAIGSAIGNIASTAIMRGVSGLKNMALAPFKKFGAMFSERIGDEMDDIKSAGGLFALDMDLTQASGNEKFFKNYNEALRFQEKLNIDMAESAASLPGVTSQYVATSRQLTDTIQMVMEKDREGFNKLAQGYGANVTAGGVDASKEAMRTVLQKQTEQVMLQSQGQTGGLPMHIAIQQLLGKEKGKIKMQAFTNKFRAAFQKNPLLKNFLLRAEKDMNDTAAGSADRLKIIMDTFDRAMPKEVINKMRGSISGMQEALRSGLLDPQAGLFGMSRANLVNGQKLMKKNVDDFGNVLYKITDDIGIDDAFAKRLKAIGIDKAAGDMLTGAELTAEQLTKLGYKLDEAGNVFAKEGGPAIGEISKSSTYIFEQIREILAGYGPVLLEFVGFLPGLFDPFGSMTESLMGFRDKAQAFISGFNKKLDILEKDALAFSNMEDPEKQGLGSALKKQSRSRAALSTVAEYLDGIGAINKDLLQKIQKRTGDTSEAGIKGFEGPELTKLVGELMQSVFNSDMMKEFAKIGGLIAGGIAKAVVDVIGMITGMAKGKGANKIMEGFSEGFREAFGGMKAADITNVFAEALSALLAKVTDILVTQVIPALGLMLVQTIAGLLTSDSLVGKLMGAFAVFKLAAVFAPLFTIIPAIISGFSVLMSAISTAAAFIAPAISGFLVALVPLIPIIAAVAGVVMIAIAVVRNFGSIMQMVGGIAQMAFGLLEQVVGQMAENIGGLLRGLGNLLVAIPGMGGVAKGIHGAGAGMQGKGGELKASGGERVSEGMSDVKIAAGTMARQFELDIEAMKAPFAQLGPSAAEADTGITALASSTDTASTSVQSFASAVDPIPAQVEAALVGSAQSAGAAITQAAQGLAQALNSAASSIKSAASAAPSTGGPKAESMFDGKGGRMMPLGQAIETERKNMPSGSNLVIANSSETVIPAFSGHMGDSFKGLSFAELESAAGFDRMASYTEQVAEIADKTAASFSGGFGGALGGGSATLNAMEALGHSFGLITTSGHRPGDPGFHGVNRARDLSNGGGETPEMNAAASKMASQFGSSLTELIYTPMGFSIKNGQKTGLISPSNHYHHIHVAVAEGLAKAAVFNSQKAAEQYERRNMPAGASPMKVDLSSMTANSSEFGGGGLTIGDINVSVSGNDPKQIANEVAEEILFAIKKTTYGELYTN